MTDSAYIYPQPVLYSEQNVCLLADLNLLDNDLDPTPMALMSDTTLGKSPGNRGKKKALVSTVEEVDGNDMVTLKLSTAVLYPNNIYVYRTAQNWTRISEPALMKNLSETNLRFR